jgi:hypothetical protein
MAPSGVKMFAAKKVIYTLHESLYVLVQCLIEYVECILDSKSIKECWAL